MNAKILFLTLLQVFPIPADYRQCIEERSYSIIDRAISAEENQNVPSGVILVIALEETHIGCARPRSERLLRRRQTHRFTNWGAPSSRTARNRNGTSFHTAIALQHSFEVCRNWEGSINRFRCGFCICNESRLIGYTPRQAIRSIQRLYSTAEISLPDNFLRPINYHYLRQP